MDLEKNHSMFTYIAESSRMISAAEPLLWPAAPARSEIGVVFPRSSWMWDWTSPTITGLEFDVSQPQHDTGYMASVYGLFRLLTQRQNIALDLLAENELTDAGLQPYKALILTQPDVPLEAQGALGRWVKAGGHLLTVAGAAASDRYGQSAAATKGSLAELSGLREAPMERLLVAQSSKLRAVAKGSGALGEFQAYGNRSFLREPLPPDAETLARFADSSAAAVRVPVGSNSGTITHFAWLPCVHMQDLDAFHRQLDFDDTLPSNKAELPYLLDFLDRSGARPLATASELHVETPLLVTDQGAVLTLLDWRSRAATPQGALPPITVRLSVRLSFNVSRVESVRQGALMEPAALQFAAAQQGEGVNVSFATELNVGDFILLWRAHQRHGVDH
eukprot:COSAG05_NODE_811_length_7176_cov_2.226791_4_plen_391_part_00